MLKRILLLFLLVSKLNAQDYRCIIPQQEQFFQEMNFNDGIYYANNASPIKVAYYDSIVSIGNGVCHYSFETYRDTSFANSGNVCAVLNGPSWLGYKVKTESDRTVFYNVFQDSLNLRTQDSVGSSWICYINVNFDEYWATIDSIGYATVAGIADSVKYISIIVKNNLGVVVANPFNNHTIEVSKNNGFFKIFSIWDFPMDTNSIVRIPTVPVLTNGQLYDFNINDGFQYQTNYYSLPPGGSLFGLIWQTIEDKYYSAAFDTVFYARHVVGYQQQFQGQTNYFNYHDTIFYTRLNDVVFDGYPEQNKFYSQHQTYSYSLEFDATMNAYKYQTIKGTAWPDSSAGCMWINMFEPEFTIKHYVPQLGLTVSIFHDDVTHFEESLTWFSSGGNSWGNFIPLVIEDVGNANNISLIPNPVTDKFQLFNLAESAEKIVLYDLQGRTVGELQGKQDNMYDVSFLKNGTYIMKVILKHGNFSKLFVKN